VRSVLVRYLNALDDRNAEKCTSPMSVGFPADYGGFANWRHRSPDGRTTVLEAIGRSVKGRRRLGLSTGSNAVIA